MSNSRSTSLLLALCLSTLAMTANAADARLAKRTVENAGKLRLAAETGTDAYAIVESLTSEVGPRMAGTPGYDRAVAWAQEKFTSLGYDKVYLEPVTFPTWERRHERAQVLAPFPQPLSITALGGSVGTGAEGSNSILAQVWIQTKGSLVTVVWSAVVSLSALYLIKAVIGLRVEPGEEDGGLDLGQHGEEAYIPGN